MAGEPAEDGAEEAASMREAGEGRYQAEDGTESSDEDAGVLVTSDRADTCTCAPTQASAADFAQLVMTEGLPRG